MIKYILKRYDTMMYETVTDTVPSDSMMQYETI